LPLFVAAACRSTGPLPPLNPDAVPSAGATAGLPDSVVVASTPTALPPTATARPVPTGATPPPKPVRLPDGFGIAVYAESLPGVRFLATNPLGELFASVPDQDRVLLLPDADRDGVADAVHVFAEGEGLNRPHGLAVRGNWLYVANTDAVVRFEVHPGERRPRGPAEVVIPNLPGGGQHWTRTIAWGPDERLYVSVGSSCDACVEENPLRAAILRFEADGSGGAVFARGLRNAVGLAFHPETEALWATENGRDLLGDDVPPDELVLVTQGADFGWPFCHGVDIPDPELAPGAAAIACGASLPPTLALQAHSAPLGLTFYKGAAFPEAYHGDLFIGYHGSWNRSVPTGYAVMRVPFADGMPAGPPEEFAAGWLEADTQRWGRPVDVLTSPDGGLFVSDDAGGRIYRIFYAPVAPTATPFSS
jgi:glucose/arabinose dehydrogenase